MHHARLFITLGIVSALALACTSTERGGFETAELANQPGFGGPEVPSGKFGGPGGTMERPTCVATQTKASHAPVDVIVVIDTSGSMDEETEQVRQNLNAFARSIGAGGLDYNVIMIARKPRATGSSLGICVQPPLAGTSCDDTAVFHHLDVDVDSENSLQIILDEYPSYSQWLRKDAYKVFIEVTDDNAALGWESFDQQLLAKSAEQFGDANRRRYIFDSICGFVRGSPILSSKSCDTAVNNGSQYQALSKLTGGTVDSVCEASYASVFDNIADDLVTRVGCEFVFPKDDGKGHRTDPSTVVVRYTPGDGASPKFLTQVNGSNECTNTSDAWHYDDAEHPTRILFCSTTCESVGMDANAKVDIDVGCKAPTPK